MTPLADILARRIAETGPITLAAGLELSNGHRAITDLGAVHDIAASLAEGVGAHRAAVSRRLDTPVVVQFDDMAAESPFKRAILKLDRKSVV